jgi:transposase
VAKNNPSVDLAAQKVDAMVTLGWGYAKRDETARRLMSIPGIGPITASAKVARAPVFCGDVAKQSKLPFLRQGL